MAEKSFLFNDMCFSNSDLVGHERLVVLQI